MPFRKPCLFIAPATDLYYAPKEAEAVVNLLHANLLNGRVEIGDLIERVRQVQPALLIISTHGNQDGILLSDGVIGADLLKPILSTTPVECVYLNTCESLATAMKIHNELPTAFVSTIAPLPDKTAYVTMEAFAYHLNEGRNYIEAWLRSKTAGNTNFLFLPSSRVTEPIMATEHIYRPPERNSNGEIKDLHEEVDRLATLIYGDEKWNLPGILPTLAKLQKDMQQIRILLGLLVLLACLSLLAVAVQWFLI